MNKKKLPVLLLFITSFIFSFIFIFEWTFSEGIISPDIRLFSIHLNFLYHGSGYDALISTRLISYMSILSASFLFYDMKKSMFKDPLCLIAGVGIISEIYNGLNALGIRLSSAGLRPDIVLSVMLIIRIAALAMPERSEQEVN
jgi:hypothetical protein